MKMKKICCIFLSLLLCLMLLPAKTGAADTAPSYLYVIYSGGSVAVGRTISTDDLRVTAVYADGTSEDVTGYSLSSNLVLTEGVNTFRVIYRGVTASFTVTGKSASQLYATYDGDNRISYGNSVGKENVAVMVYYSDGSWEEVTDFTLGNSVIQTIGTQRVYVMYGGLMANLDVIGIAAKNVSSLYISYRGGDVIEGNAVNREDIIVTAAYADGTTERIYNFDLSPEIISDLGTNRVTVTYRGGIATFQVEGIVRTLESITASYSGTQVQVGRYVDPKEITVTGEYNDGTKEEIEEFELLSDRILNLGNNVVTVSCQGLKATITVQGVENITNTFDHTSSFQVTNGTKSASVLIALPKTVETDVITGKSLKPERVRNVLTKVEAQDEEYIAFDVILEDETADDVFPLQMQITLPASFPAEDTSVYYTPNRKTVIGRMAAEEKSSRVLELTIYHAGTYVIVYQEIEEIEYEEDDDDDDYLD